MGEPVLIRDLAEQMIRFYGFEPDRDIKIEYTGIRSGERLDERLWTDDEEPVPTESSRIFKVRNRSTAQQNKAMADAENLVERLYPIINFDPAQKKLYRNSGILTQILREAIPGF
jgi:FlaA1/EpsC-like NDP-sugar epimerase